MRVIYNGVDLMALETHEFAGEPVYDDTGTDYLYTKYTVHVTAVAASILAPAPLAGPFMAYRFEGGMTGPTPPDVRPPSPARGAIAPGAGDGIAFPAPASEPRVVRFLPGPVPLSHRAVRHRLTTPRGPLYVFAGGGMEVGNPAQGFAPPAFPDAEMILFSPQAPYDVDCKNGPTPTLFRVIEAMGDAETFVVEFAVETYVNEALENNARPFGPLLSNRWRQLHSVDRDGYTVVATEGVAIFRTDFVYQLDSSPDVSRPVLFMPVPQGFTRVVDAVETREDVTGIGYRYTDTQVPVNFVAGPFVGASQISAVHRQEVTADIDVFGRMIETLERGIGLAANTRFAGLVGREGKTKRPPAGPGTARLRVPGAPPPDPPPGP